MCKALGIAWQIIWIAKGLLKVCDCKVEDAIWGVGCSVSESVESDGCCV